MSEQLNNYHEQQEASVFNAEDADSRQGIEGVDIGNESSRVGESILENHMQEYDHFVGAAHDFVKDKLGMSDVQPLERAAVLSKEIAEQWGVGTNGGHYLPELGVAYVFEQKTGRPKTDKLTLASSLVHELAHSATVTPENARSENVFYHEAIAGMAEYFALKNLSDAGEFTQAPDMVLTRNIDGEDVSIIVPGDFRRVDASETTEGKADSTQALLAAMVVGMGLKITGKSASEILTVASRSDTTAYDAMKEAVNSIDPSLSELIEGQEGTTDQIIKVVQKAQQSVGVI